MINNKFIKPEEKKLIKDACNTCRTPIYEGEVVYTSSEEFRKMSWGKNTALTTFWIQCAWCYDQWQNEMVKSDLEEKEKRKRGKWFWIINGFISLAISVAVASFLEEKNILLLFVIIIGVAFLVLFVLAPLVLWIYRKIFWTKPIINRYQIRNRNTVSETTGFAPLPVTNSGDTHLPPIYPPFHNPQK